MVKYYIEFYNGAIWADGGTFYEEWEARNRYRDYKRRYGHAKLYELTTTARRIEEC